MNQEESSLTKLIQREFSLSLPKNIHQYCTYLSTQNGNSNDENLASEWKGYTHHHLHCRGIVNDDAWASDLKG